MRDNDETQGSIDETDVEGHRNLAKDVGPDSQRQLGKDDGVGPEGTRRMAGYSDDQDVEGHRQLVKDAEPDGMHQTGPTTQGEIFRRWPSDNPHGDS